MNLDGTRWSAISIAGRSIPPGIAPTLAFSDGLASGSAGCNGYSSQERLAIDGNTLRLGPILSTLGRCVDSNGQDAPIMATEEAFLSVLRSADHIAVVDGQLVIGGPQGDIAFTRSQGLLELRSASDDAG